MPEYSPQEILKIAINVEENGLRFYETLEKRAVIDCVKEVWKYLKEQESAHKRVFKEMLDCAPDYITYEYSPGEYNAYLRAISSSFIFIPELIKKKTEEVAYSDKDAVDFGIQIEKDSILVYSALKEYIKLDKQSALNKVIEEEKNHLIRLTLFKEGLIDINS
ncbi:MAG: ferritin family protein [Candidatus Omnitrophota bacterium]